LDPCVELLVNDSKIKAVVDAYLDGPSDLRSVQLWVSNPGLPDFPSSEAAQQFHYDLDTLKWIKVFVYLSDVTMESGPHCALLGTHLPGSKNSALAARMYERISDEDIQLYQSILVCYLYNQHIPDSLAFQIK
jgi:hypothetical protein